MAKKAKEDLSYREFDKRDTELCSTNCMYFSNRECTLYGEHISSSGYSSFRIKKCLKDFIPDNNAEMIMLLRRICKKLNA